MAGLPTSSSAARNRLLVWLLLGTLFLSTGLNLYLLAQAPDYPEDYAPMLETMAQVELLQTRQALAECQAGHAAFIPDSLSHASVSEVP